jgi:hypothetical protein
MRKYRHSDIGEGNCWILKHILLHGDFITDHYFIFHNIFIYDMIQVLDFGGILCFSLCIITILPL